MDKGYEFVNFGVLVFIFFLSVVGGCNGNGPGRTDVGTATSKATGRPWLLLLDPSTDLIGKRYSYKNGRLVSQGWLNGIGRTIKPDYETSAGAGTLSSERLDQIQGNLEVKFKELIHLNVSGNREVSTKVTLSGIEIDSLLNVYEYPIRQQFVMEGLRAKKAKVKIEFKRQGAIDLGLITDNSKSEEEKKKLAAKKLEVLDKLKNVLTKELQGSVELKKDTSGKLEFEVSSPKVYLYIIIAEKRDKGLSGLTLMGMDYHKNLLKDHPAPLRLTLSTMETDETGRYPEETYRRTAERFWRVPEGHQPTFWIELTRKDGKGELELQVFEGETPLYSVPLKESSIPDRWDVNRPVYTYKVAGNNIFKSLVLILRAQRDTQNPEDILIYVAKMHYPEYKLVYNKGQSIY